MLVNCCDNGIIFTFILIFLNSFKFWLNSFESWLLVVVIWKWTLGDLTCEWVLTISVIVEMTGCWNCTLRNCRSITAIRMTRYVTSFVVGFTWSWISIFLDDALRSGHMRLFISTCSYLDDQCHFITVVTVECLVPLLFEMGLKLTYLANWVVRIISKV